MQSLPSPSVMTVPSTSQDKPRHESHLRHGSRGPGSSFPLETGPHVGWSRGQDDAGRKLPHRRGRFCSRVLGYCFSSLVFKESALGRCTQLSGVRACLLKGGVQSSLPKPDFHVLPAPPPPPGREHERGRADGRGLSRALPCAPAPNLGFCDLGGGTAALRAGRRGLGRQKPQRASEVRPVPPAPSQLWAWEEHADSGTVGFSTPLPGLGCLLPRGGGGLGAVSCGGGSLIQSWEGKQRRLDAPRLALSTGTPESSTDSRPAVQVEGAALCTQ